MADRAAKRIELDNEWHKKHDAEGDIQEDDFTYEGPRDGIEDDEQVEVSYEGAPLNKRQRSDCMFEPPLPPWRRKANRASTTEVRERSWEKPQWMKRKGPVAKSNSMKKWKRKKGETKEVFRSFEAFGERERLGDDRGGTAGNEDDEHDEQDDEHDEHDEHDEPEEFIFELNGLSNNPACGHEYERADMLIDSGASVCGCPRYFARGHPKLPREGRESFRAANNGQILNQGSVEITAGFQNGDLHKMKFAVMDLQRIIVAVSRMVKAGNRVVFDSAENGGSYIYNKKSGRYHVIHERNGVYVVPIWIRRPTTTGFRGHPTRV